MGKGGGGGGQPTQTTSNVTNTNVPEYARPYVENMLGATQKQLFQMKGNNVTGFQPYKAYGGTYDEAGNQTAYDPSKAIAGFSPMQQQAQQNAANMQAGPGDFNSQVGAYMSPYMQNVVDVQKREAMRQSGIQGVQQQAQATQAGAFGGSRDAIQRAERERNLGTQMNDIQAQGLQAAYGQAANQYNQGFGQNLQVNQLQNTLGGQQQQNQQQIINQSMQDYANAQQYPLMQLGTMSNMLRGLPMQAQTTQQYQAQANPITQGIGAIGSLGSLAQVKAEGGAVRSMASGGITSIPRYDVGGAVVSQLATMPDEALKKEAMESPSPRVREMAAAILKQRQAGMNAEPQMEAAPAQGVGPMGVDYNANYAGGGIIAFADGKKVDAEEAARNAKQTEMYIAGAKLAAEQRAAEEQARAAAQPASKGVPLLLNKDTLPDEQATSVAGRLADTIGGGISSVARGITDKWDALSAMREQNQKRAAAIPGFFESLTPAQRAERAAQEKAAAKEYEKIYTNKFQPYGSKPIGDSSGFKAYVGPSGKAPESSTLLQGGREPIGIDSVGTTVAEKRAPVVAEKRAPVVVKEAGPAADVAAKVPPALLDRNAPPYTGSAVEAAPTGIAAVDPLADIRTAAKNAQDVANKSQQDIYKENQAALKAQGLDTSEARDQYMKAQQAQRAETEKSFQNREYLRRAEFFATWGSTPGNTLVAGMTALKKTIPDMIQDTTDKRAALQQADKAIYELGEAVRLEKLGMWEKAAAQKLQAAKTAADLQEKLATATASIEGHKISAGATMGAANVRAASDEKGYLSAEKIADIKAKVDRETNAGAAAARKQAAELHAEAQKGAKDSTLYSSALQLQANVESQINNVMKSAEYEQLRLTANMTPSDSNKKLIADARAALNTYAENFKTQRQAAATAIKEFGGRLGVTPNADSASGVTSQAEFDKKWPTLKSGQSMVGPNGQTYTKK